MPFDQYSVAPPIGDPGAHFAEQANIPPNSARAALRIAEAKGLDPERLCRGLGFGYRDLVAGEWLLSYQQIRRLLLRIIRQIGDPAPGVAAGAAQSPVSWGLPGLLMHTFPTLGEAVQFALQYQIEAGALLEHRLEVTGDVVHIVVSPKYFDKPVEAYLIEEGLAGALAVGRYLLGEPVRPLRVEMSFPETGHAEACQKFFRCPVEFGCGESRMTLAARWLAAPLHGYDPVTCTALREQLVPLLVRPAGPHDLIATVAGRMRATLGDAPVQTALAKTANMSERTLRRRLQAQSVSYRGLRDEARYELARDLLRHSSMSISEIAAAVGYADPRAFRRAFRRWSGMLPTAFRQVPAVGDTTD